MNNTYIATDGTNYDITTLNTERLINSLSLHHRNIYNAKTKEEFVFHSEQIVGIDTELLRREKEFFDKRKASGQWK